MRARKKIAISGLAVTLLLVVFYLGMIVGAAHIATKDVNFNGLIYLDLANKMRQGEHERVQGRLDFLLKGAVSDIGVWSNRAYGKQRKVMFETVRRIARYYDEYHDGKLGMPPFEEGALPYGQIGESRTEEAYRESYEAAREQYNERVRKLIEIATAPDEVRAYEEMRTMEEEQATKRLHDIVSGQER